MPNTYTTQDVENIKKRASELGMNLDPTIQSQLSAGASKGAQDTPISSVFGSQSEDDIALEKAREAQYRMIQDSASYNPDVDDPIIRAKAISSVQSEIDALNKAAAEQKAEIARRLGIQSTGELWNQRALLAGSGML